MKDVFMAVMKYICRHVCFILLFSLYSMLFCLFNFVVVLLMHFHFHYCSYCIFLLLLTWCSCSSRSPECLMPVYTLFRTIWRSPSWTETWRPTRLQPAFARKHAVHLVGWIQWWSMMLPCNHSHFFHVFLEIDGMEGHKWRSWTGTQWPAFGRDLHSRAALGGLDESAMRNVFKGDFPIAGMVLATETSLSLSIN